MEFNEILTPIGKVILAMLLGGLLGTERELARKPAGLRTHMLVSGAASLLMVLGDFMIESYSSGVAVNAIRADPIRIIEAIITGISFLGAGTIIFRKPEDTVEGLTTAAAILYTAAIGITVALGQYLLALILTFLAIAILLGLGYIDPKIKRLRKYFYEDRESDKS